MVGFGVVLPCPPRIFSSNHRKRNKNRAAPSGSRCIKSLAAASSGHKLIASAKARAVFNGKGDDAGRTPTVVAIFSRIFCGFRSLSSSLSSSISAIYLRKRRRAIVKERIAAPADLASADAKFSASPARAIAPRFHSGQFALRQIGSLPLTRCSFCARSRKNVAPRICSVIPARTPGAKTPGIASPGRAFYSQPFFPGRDQSRPYNPEPSPLTSHLHESR